MRCRFLAVVLLAISPSLANGEEPSPPVPAPTSKAAPLVREITERGPSERLVHLKAALAHLERAGFDEPEIASAARIIGGLIDAEKSDEADNAADS